MVGWEYVVVERFRALGTCVLCVLASHSPVAREGTITTARRLIAAGADIVVGSHAHREQGGGRRGQALVDDGLGNFVWYSQNGGLSITTGVLKVTVTGRRIDRYSWVPATIIGGSPTPLSGSSRAAAISSWRGLRGCTNLRT
jgi:poly-gamma-glutamate synthesis protein (capsule biosynthesis protein)